MPEKAFIFGINGQDGSYLAEMLIEKGYDVAGAVRGGSSLHNLASVRGRVCIETLDLSGPAFVRSLLERHCPGEVYNLASQSHVGRSWDSVAETVEAGALFPARIIDAIHGMGGGIKYFQASTGALFCGADSIQTEQTPLSPCDPYGFAKYLPHRMVAAYRERYGYHFCSGILYNHESPRRPESFVTRKITKAAARIKLGKQSELRLGNLDSVRDWGYAPEYVRGMWMMLQAKKPDDYILATGKGRTVRDFVETAFRLAGLDWREHVAVDESFVRPNDGLLVGDPSKIGRELGWKAEMSFENMVRAMLEADLELETET